MVGERNGLAPIWTSPSDPCPALSQYRAEIGIRSGVAASSRQCMEALHAARGKACEGKNGEVSVSRIRRGVNRRLNQVTGYRSRVVRLSRIVVATGALLVAICARAGATADLFNIDGQPLVLSATEQSREEVWNWFTPTNPTKGPDYQNRYNFMGSWIRVGLGYQLDGVKGFAELMSPFFINLPDNAIVPPPPAKIKAQGLLGLGANYYQPHQHPNDASVFLKQAYLEFGRNLLPGLNLKGGRFEFFDGLEYAPTDLDPQLKWLATNRISQ